MDTEPILDLSLIPDTLAAWIAGIIEGEGCIRIQVSNVRDWRTKRLLKDRATMSVTVGMKDETVMRQLARLGGHFYKQNRIDWNPVYVWTISSRPALAFLERIEPFIIGDKKPQALLAIEFQRGRIPGRTRTPARYAYEMDAARRISEMKNVRYSNPGRPKPKIQRAAG